MAEKYLDHYSLLEFAMDNIAVIISRQNPLICGQVVRRACEDDSSAAFCHLATKLVPRVAGVYMTRSRTSRKTELCPINSNNCEE